MGDESVQDLPHISGVENSRLTTKRFKTANRQPKRLERKVVSRQMAVGVSPISLPMGVELVQNRTGKNKSTMIQQLNLVE